ncbi:MAG: NosD domain-containing protein [Candidatus Thorarchaeota archaeon]
MKERQHTNKMIAHPTLKGTSTQAYIEHGPITITSDVQLNNSGYPGNGTLDDPIRIEGYNITFSSGDLISISDTQYYFTITNCLLNGLTTASNGIKLENVANSRIENSFISNTGDSGLYLIFSGDNIIFNNTIENTGIGMDLELSDNNLIMNNTITESQGWTQINLWDSSLNTLANNTIQSSDGGIAMLSSSQENTFTQNTVHHCGGMFIEASSDNLVSDNTFYNNTVGVKVENASGTNIIANTILNSSCQGIWCRFTNFTTVTQNTVWNSFTSGIILRNDTDGNITNNICYNNGLIARPGQPLYEDEYATGGITAVGPRILISENDVNNNYHNGILYLGEDSNISDNIVRTNGRNGIAVTGNYTIIERNDISGNTKKGIFLGAISYQLNITRNLCYDNAEYGLAITLDSSRHYIYNNDFMNNNVGGVQATDNGSSNTFEYNYWNDWSRIGLYTIDGDEGNQDFSPLANPYHMTAPSITTPTTDNTTLEGDVVIQWTTSSDAFSHSLTYSVLCSPNDGGSWTTLASGLTTTTYTWDTTTIADGTILLKVQVEDSIGFIAETVLATSFLIDNEGLTEPTVLSPNGGETLTGIFTIKWTAAVDSMDHAVSYTVYYSLDEGATWIEVASGLTTTSYAWNTTTAPNGFSYLIKVVAICSAKTTSEDVSDDTFSVQNEEQTSTITTTTAPSTPIGPTPGITGVIILSTLAIVVIGRKRRK